MAERNPYASCEHCGAAAGEPCWDDPHPPRTTNLMSVDTKAEPAVVRAALLAIANALAQRAEHEYDKDPNHNGPTAQPFADAAALVEAAADAVTEQAPAQEGAVWLEPG